MFEAGLAVFRSRPREAPPSPLPDSESGSERISLALAGLPRRIVAGGQPAPDRSWLPIVGPTRSCQELAPHSGPHPLLTGYDVISADLRRALLLVSCGSV